MPPDVRSALRWKRLMFVVSGSSRVDSDPDVAPLGRSGWARRDRLRVAIEFVSKKCSILGSTFVVGRVGCPPGGDEDRPLGS